MRRERLTWMLLALLTPVALYAIAAAVFSGDKTQAMFDLSTRNSTLVTVIGSVVALTASVVAALILGRRQNDE